MEVLQGVGDFNAPAFVRVLWGARWGCRSVMRVREGRREGRVSDDNWEEEGGKEGLEG